MKLYEIAEGSEWDNVPFEIDTQNRDYQAFQKEKNKRLLSLRNQECILTDRYIAMEDKYPAEFMSRGVPDENDHESEWMDVPNRVENNPDGYDTIKIPGRWLYDMKYNEGYPDAHEEFYLLKTSPRYQTVKRILNREAQIVKMREQSYLWPPTVRK